MSGNRTQAIGRAVARVCAVAALVTLAVVGVQGTATADPVEVTVGVGVGSPYPGPDDWRHGEPGWWDRRWDSQWDRYPGYPGWPGGWWGDPFPRDRHRGHVYPFVPFGYTGSFGSS